MPEVDRVSRKRRTAVVHVHHGEVDGERNALRHARGSGDAGTNVAAHNSGERHSVGAVGSVPHYVGTAKSENPECQAILTRMRLLKLGTRKAVNMYRATAHNPVTMIQFVEENRLPESISGCRNEVNGELGRNFSTTALFAPPANEECRDAGGPSVATLKSFGCVKVSVGHFSLKKPVARRSMFDSYA